VERTEKSFRGLFFYSIIYLFAIFGSLVLDKLIQSLSGWSWLAF
jgi:heme O synthase-like polyprenyltransferase